MGSAIRNRPAGVAHRVFCDGDETARRNSRYSLRRRRQHLPTPRERDRSKRGRHRKALRPVLVHGEHLLVEGEKMAKSKGNFYTLRDLIDRGYDPLAIR